MIWAAIEKAAQEWFQGMRRHLDDPSDLDAHRGWVITSYEEGAREALNLARASTFNEAIAIIEAERARLDELCRRAFIRGGVMAELEEKGWLCAALIDEIQALKEKK